MFDVRKYCETCSAWKRTQQNYPDSSWIPDGCSGHTLRDFTIESEANTKVTLKGKHNESVFQTTSPSYQEASTWSPNLPAGMYLIQYCYEASNSDSSQKAGVRIQIDDTTTIAEGNHAPDESASGFYIHNHASDGSVQIDMDLKAVSSGTARVRRRRIIIERIDDWGE